MREAELRADAKKLAKFAKEDGEGRCSFGRPEEYVCGGMPQASADSYVFVRLPITR